MQLYDYLKPKMHFIGLFAVAITMVSCGSYQYAGYEDDSIYGRTERTVDYANNESSADNSLYYKDYFKEKTEQYAGISDDSDVIFTDIDSYEGVASDENDTIYDGNYAGWGENNSDVTINIYGGHAFNSIWWNRPYYTSWGWNYGYGYGNLWGYGFNNYYGWNRPLWLDFGYGYGYGFPYYYGGYYGYPYYYGNIYYGNFNGYYEGNYYNRRPLAYNSTRRGASYTANRTMGNTSRRSTINSSNTRRTTVGDLNRRTTNRRSILNSNTNRRSINSNATRRIQTNSTRTRPTTTRSNNTRTRSNNTSTRSRTIRSNNNTSSRSGNNISRSTIPTRSSSSIRSSSSGSTKSRRGNNQ
jgi:hypothetical protein